MKRIMVDMTASIIHHGHIRLLKKASKHGEVIIALTSDEEIKKHKGYYPEIKYSERCEILESIKYVNEVVESPWVINELFLDKYSIDFLVHGHDNVNPISTDRLLILPRTEGVSSSKLREKILQTASSQKKTNKGIL